MGSWEYVPGNTVSDRCWFSFPFLPPPSFPSSPLSRTSEHDVLVSTFQGLDYFGNWKHNAMLAEDMTFSILFSGSYCTFLYRILPKFIVFTPLLVQFFHSMAFYTPFVVRDSHSLLIKQIGCFNVMLQVLIKAIFPTADHYLSLFWFFLFLFFFLKLRKLSSRDFYFICST